MYMCVKEDIQARNLTLNFQLNSFRYLTMRQTHLIRVLKYLIRICIRIRICKNLHM